MTRRTTFHAGTPCRPCRFRERELQAAELKGKHGTELPLSRTYRARQEEFPGRTL